MQRISRLGRLTMVAGLLALVAAAPATTSAAPLVREHYRGTDSYTFEDCGFLVEAEASFEGLFMLKAGRAGDPTPYYFDNYKAATVYTNPATGKWVTFAHNGMYRDLRVELLEGTTYAFTSIEVGQPFVVTDMNGKVLVRDEGLLETRFVVDTLGDGNLENDIFIDESWSLQRDAGNHPGFYLDFCEILASAIG